MFRTLWYCFPWMWLTAGWASGHKQTLLQYFSLTLLEKECYGRSPTPSENHIRSHLSQFRLVSYYMWYIFTSRGLCIVARKNVHVKLRERRRRNSAILCALFTRISHWNWRHCRLSNCWTPFSAVRFLLIAVFCMHQLTVISETLLYLNLLLKLIWPISF